MPQSLAQFGQTIKAKHPEYADMSDEDVAGKVLAKYPQYEDMVDRGAASGSAAPIGNTGATLSPAAAPTWLQSAESDLRYGGKRTAIGAILGALQGGNGGKGYSGAMGGVSPAAAQFMASPALGLIHGAQGAQETVSGHPLTGMLHSVEGGLEAATIPSYVVGGPAGDAAAAAVESVPSAKHAGQVLQQIMSEAGHVPVTPDNVAESLFRVHELGQRGSVVPKAAKQLLDRFTKPRTEPLTYSEARDFASNISRISADEAQRLTPVMKSALGSVRENLHADIRAAADTVGRGEDYVSAIREYSRAHSLSDALQKVGKWGAGIIGAGGAYSAYDHFRR